MLEIILAAAFGILFLLAGFLSMIEYPSKLPWIARVIILGIGCSFILYALKLLFQL